MLLITLTAALSWVSQEEQFAACVRQIFERYVSPQQTVFVSYEKAPGIAAVLGAINSEGNWSLHVACTECEADSPFYDYMGKYYTYLVCSDNAYSVLEQISTMAFQINNWNARAQFLLVISDFGEETPEQVADFVLTDLWKGFQIINIALVIPSEQKKSLQVFTLDPYKGYSNPVLMIDEWLSEGVFLKNVVLLGNKVPKYFDGMPVKVCAGNYPPISIPLSNTTDENNVVTYDFTGLEVEFLKVIMQKLNMSIVFHALPFHYNIHQVFTKTLEKIAYREVDLGIGGLVFLPVLMAYGDPIFPYEVTGAKAFVPCPVPVQRLQKISQIFSLSVWIMMLIVILLVAFFMNLLAKNSLDRVHAGYRTLGLSLHNIWAVMLGVGVSEMPHTALPRLFFLMFVIYAFAISMVFQTFFTSVLVDPGLTSQITSIEELLASGLPFGSTPGQDSSLYETDDSDWKMKEMKRKRIACLDFVECLKWTAIDGNFSVVKSEFLARYVAANQLPKRVTKLCAIDEFIKMYRSAFYFTKGSPLLHRFVEVQKLVIESGFYDKINKDVHISWEIARFSDKRGDFNEEDEDGYFVFALDHLMIAFVFLFMGLGVGVLILLGEIVRHRLATGSVPPRVQKRK